ncbi:restriction endonuclease [Neobacillus kokaensis]|uniref:Restriction endonuclease type IV Mrr domain-containing protein n=1 Tax=Neobacillus kokaensis TaxID=2759023 RepID=A0ABQ3N538_9BACI|nr:restriction endonuclease [Neobacillus kokaensis]GHH98637.1 hypothetical protein AM1BK_21800 [Neobacillus kokaensis]
MIEVDGINWSEVNHQHFEKFIYYLLAFEGHFYNRMWFGKGGGDKGRDVVAKTFEKLPFGLAYERKWIFQCKKWATMPDKGAIMNEAFTVMEHKPDYWVLVIPVDPSPDKIDYFSVIEENANFKMVVIPLSQIQELLYKYPELKYVLLNGKFPDTSAEPLGVKKIEILDEKEPTEGGEV